MSVCVGELWCLFARHVEEKAKRIATFFGTMLLSYRHFGENSNKSQDGRVGALMGVSLIQGGSGYPQSTFSYLCGKQSCSLLVGRNEIPDPDVDKKYLLFEFGTFAYLL